MSIAAIRAALETALNAMAPAVLTAWENNPFVPPASTVPYQQVFVLFATPDNREAGVVYTEIGYMQVSLKYPLDVGSSAAMARAIMLRNTFKKANSFSNSGVTVIIDKTPAIVNGTVDVDRWSLPVKIPFHADIY